MAQNNFQILYPMKKTLVCNLTKSWKTTLIGSVILMAAIISVFVSNSITWMDASIGIGIGLALLFAPDSLIKRISSLFSKKNENDCSARKSW